MGQSIKQMMIVTGGVFFSISVLCLIIGGWSAVGKNQLDAKIKAESGNFLDNVTGKVHEDSMAASALDSAASGAFTTAGITGVIAIGFCVIGRNKKQA